MHWGKKITKRDKKNDMRYKIKNDKRDNKNLGLNKNTRTEKRAQRCGGQRGGPGRVGAQNPEKVEVRRVWAKTQKRWGSGWGPEGPKPRKGGCPMGVGQNPEKVGAEVWGAQNFSLFFPPTPAPCSLFVSLSEETLWVVHGRDPWPQFNEKTPESKKKNEKCGGRGKKERNFGWSGEGKKQSSTKNGKKWVFLTFCMVKKGPTLGVGEFHGRGD